MPWPAEQQSKPRPGPAAESSTITIGRNPQSDVSLDFEIISWDHARVTLEHDGWTRRWGDSASR